MEYNANLDDVSMDEGELQESELLKIKSKKILFHIFRYLPMEELSYLSSTCRQLNYYVQEYMQELQVIVDDEHGVQHLVHLEKNNVVLNRMNPELFLFPDPPFQRVVRLSLNFSGGSTGKINLTKLPNLKYLKVRGPNIKLSSNRLKTVTDVDIDDPDCCERQVFPNMKNFSVTLDVEEISQIYNSTESKALEYIFIKALDILTGKRRIECIKFSLNLFMEILVFEKFVDSLDTFLQDYEEVNGEGKIEVLLKHNTDYLDEKYYEEEYILEKNKQLQVGMDRRFEFAFQRLDITLVNRHYNFKIDYEEVGLAPIY